MWANAIDTFVYKIRNICIYIYTSKTAIESLNDFSLFLYSNSLLIYFVFFLFLHRKFIRNELTGKTRQ